MLYRHNSLRDILGHSARAAGLSAVVEKKNQIEGSNEKPGDITVQQYHRGFPSSAFDVTVTHPLQKKYLEVAMEEAGVAAQDAHDKKLQKSLEICEKRESTSSLSRGSRSEVPPRRYTTRRTGGRSWRVHVVATRLS